MFDFEKLKALPVDARLEYCDKELKVLGIGGTRTVYELSPKKVLKVANGWDRDSNVSEMLLYSECSSRYRPYLAKIYEIADDGSYLIVEKVLPAKMAHFKEWYGVGVRNPINLMNRRKINRRIKEQVQALRYFQGMFNLDDIGHFPNWGRRINGRVVILDYAANCFYDCAEDYYNISQ